MTLKYDMQKWLEATELDTEQAVRLMMRAIDAMTWKPIDVYGLSSKTVYLDEFGDVTMWDDHATHYCTILNELGEPE